jgi:hypothetical protein
MTTAPTSPIARDTGGVTAAHTDIFLVARRCSTDEPR